MNDIEAEMVEVESSPPPVADEKEALRQSIERSEAELREAVEELTAAVKSEVTLSGHITDKPLTWIAGGFAVGVLLAWRR